MKSKIITQLTFVFLLIVGFNIVSIQAQDADPAITGAVFDPDEIVEGATSELQITFSNAGFDPIPAASIELTINTPESTYMSDGITAPGGPGGALFSWVYSSAGDFWRGTNIAAIPAFGGGMIALEVEGITESANYEVTNVNVQPVASFSMFDDAPGNNNEQPGLLVSSGCPDPLDTDMDGLTDCEETTGVDDLSTDAEPDGITDENDPCDPDPSAVASGDCDMDGNPNGTDPNPEDPETEDDMVSGVSTEPTTVNILDNDDFLPGMNTSITIVNMGTTAGGMIEVDPLTGILTYTGLESEEGMTVEIEYEVCNTDASPDPVCETAIVEVMVTDGCPNTIDTDMDGLTDCEEETGIDDLSTDATPDGTSSPSDPCDPDPSAVASGDCDMDGNPNGTDPNPTEAVAVNDTMDVITGDPVTFNIVTNDDFIPGPDLSIDTLPGFNGEGVLTIDPLTGMITYESVPEDAGLELLVDYQICNTAVNPEVCAVATIKIDVVSGVNISGVVFADTLDVGPQFGQFDAGEEGVESFNVALLDSTGMIVDQTVTDADGEYAFENVGPGKYFVEFDFNDPWEAFTIDSLGAPETASYVTSSNGRTDIFEVIDEDIENVNAGLVLCGGFACKGSMNISIAEDCSANLTPGMLLAKQKFPDTAYTIIIMNLDGSIRPDDVFTLDDIGSTFEVSVVDNVCNNTCWLPVTIEYKFKPVIECADNDTLSCTQAFDDSVIIPSIMSNCASVELTLINENQTNLSCDSSFTAMLERSWVAIDEYGNSSDTCTQTILLERTNLDSISPVTPYAIYNNNAIDCGSEFATTSQGYPYPALSVAGAPQLEVEAGVFVDLYPFDANVICNGFAEFEDEILPGSTSCVTKILRTFTIGEWWCGGTNEREFIQLIEVVDFTGPELTCPADLTVSTANFTCESSVSVNLPTASDLCNGNNITIDLGTPAGFFEDYNGESVMLPVGVHTLTYTAYDDCENNSQCTFEVTVQDNADPIAICDQFTEVGISLDTTTFIYAEALDDGSFDECGPVTLSVARMDDPGFEDLSGFEEKANVYCDDAGGDVMFGLLVTDAGGNTNMCMVSVSVTDKVDAKMICPGPMTVECNFPFDEDNLSAFFGEVEILDNCPASNTIDEDLIGELSSCGNGVLTRQIRLLNPQGVQVDYCEQVITFENGDPLSYSDITPPPSEVSVTGCGVSAIDPNILGLPVVPIANCQQTSMNITNDTFPFTQTDGACLKIIRTFKIIDWCIIDGYGSIHEPFEFEQIIKVNNTDKPEFSNVFESDSTYCSFASDCGGLTLTGLTANVTDECTPDNELVNRYETRDSEGEIVKFGLGLNASGYYDLGSYTVRFISEDKCGNQQVTESSFEIISCKQPTPYCLNGLSTTLTAMDTDDDGIADAEMVMLTPEFFDAGSYHVCGYDVVLSFSADITDTIAEFFCSDTVGVVNVELWVTALDEEGNPLPDMADFCVAELDVQNNEDIDLCNGLKVSVQGRVFTELDAQLNNAEIELRSEESISEMTDETGHYGFMDMPRGGSYELAPSKDDDVLNGVSTLDLVMIQRHLLGISEIEGPYKRIAADINRDDRLTASDLLALRKVILGVNDKFPNNTSWRFIDEAYVFDNPQDPWEAIFPESYDINVLIEDMWIDFLGIKVGDINGNVNTNLAAGLAIETRSDKTMIMSMPNITLKEGSTYGIQVQATDELDVRGLQYAFALEGIEIVEVEAGNLNVSNHDIAVQEDIFKMSFANADVSTIANNNILFTLVVKAKQDGRLSEMISLDDKAMSAESYLSDNLEVGKIAIEWRDDQAEAVQYLTSLNVAPNPWKSRTEIAFDMPKSGYVTLKVMDPSGRLLLTKSNEFGAGEQIFNISNEDVRISGVLLYEIRYDDQVIKGKMIKIE